ncbi:MAG: FixH family protein [Alphaproteobacteria bacterium]
MTRQRARGWWYPYIFVGMFGVVIVVNLVMAYFATSTFPGLATDRPFERGLAYNAAIADEEAQARLGWRMSLAARPSAPGHADVAVTVVDRLGAPVDGLAVSADLRRPTVAGHDRTLTLVRRAPGHYGAETSLDLPGQWEVRVTASLGDHVHRLRERILVP